MYFSKLRVWDAPGGKFFQHFPSVILLAVCPEAGPSGGFAKEVLEAEAGDLHEMRIISEIILQKQSHAYG